MRIGDRRRDCLRRRGGAREGSRRPRSAGRRSILRPSARSTPARPGSGRQGAAYFSPDGRFKAWSRSGGKLTQGFGTWSIRSDGGICFTANWQTIPAKPLQGAGKSVETCFAHQARGNAIAQMKLPNGPWYFFRRSPPRKTDEFFKLQYRRSDPSRRLEGFQGKTLEVTRQSGKP